MLSEPATYGTVAAIASAIAAFCSAYITWFNARVQREIERRRFISQIWDKLAVSDINVEKGQLVLVDLITMLNGLEFAAICWDAGLVNKRMAYLVTHSTYLHFYDQISSINYKIDIDPNHRTYHKTGKELLDEKAVIGKVHNEMKQMRQRANSM